MTSVLNDADITNGYTSLNTKLGSTHTYLARMGTPTLSMYSDPE